MLPDDITHASSRMEAFCPAGGRASLFVGVKVSAMWNVERMICNSLWTLWVAAMADRPADKTPAFAVVRRTETTGSLQLYPDRTMLPGW
jgi:hypothetical protein